MKKRLIISLKASYQQWLDNLDSFGMRFRNNKILPKHYFEIEEYIYNNKINKEKAEIYRKERKRMIINS